MFLVDRPMLAPGICMFTGTNAGPLIDLGRDFDIQHEGRMYVKASFAMEMAELAGAPSRKTVNDALGENEVLKMRVAELERENRELREFNEAARYTVESMGQHVRKKPGRKPQPQAA